jgi:hypothetical protein
VNTRNAWNTLSTRNFRTRSRAFGALLALVAGAACIGHVACSKEPTALVVSVATDMALVADLDAVGLYVGVDGEVKTSVRAEVSEDKTVKLPGTLSILQPKNESTPVHIRIAGYKGGELRVVRDSIATVPSAQLTLLRMPLNWLSASHLTKSQGTRTASAAVAGNVVVRDVTGSSTENFPEMAPYFPGVIFPCPAGQTSSEGRCIDVNVAPDSLVKISGADLVREVYGEALGVNAETGVAEGGTCFDIASCFANDQTLKPEDIVGCKVRIPNLLANTKTLNFGLVRDPASGCKDKECFVPLDWDGRYDETTKTYALPPEACDRLTSTDPKTRVTRVSVATNCDAKTALRPRCNALYGAVRDKAPSDPTRVPYYETPEPLPDGAAPPPQDGGRDGDASEGGTPGPLLLGRLTKLTRPRRIAFSNDRLWVRGEIGLGFLDARGPSTPTEVSPLPTTSAGVNDVGGLPVVLVTSGNDACTATAFPTTTSRWCYSLGTLTRADSYNIASASSSVGPVVGLVSTASVGIVSFSKDKLYLDYPTFRGTGALAGPNPAVITGVGSTVDDRLLAAFIVNEPSLRVSTAAIDVRDLSFGTLATFAPPYDGHVGRIEIARDTKEVFYTLGDPNTSQGAIFRKAFANAGATPGTLVTATDVPYAPGPQSSPDGPTLALDSEYIYWAGGPAGPMAISRCTTRTVTPKALFPSGGGLDNTTFAIATAGSKVYFATNDGRVYSMPAPAPESCP